MDSRRWTFWTSVGLCGLVVAASALRIPEPRVVHPIDIEVYLYPIYEATYGRLASGVLPLWNPYQLCGIPWLGPVQGGFFFPLHALYLLLPLHVALAVSHLVILVLVTLSTAAFARRAGLSSAAAILAAMLFGLRGLLVLSLSNPNYAEASAWLPLGGLAVLTLARECTPGAVALLAAATALSFLAGYPQPTVYMLYTWGSLLVALLLGARATPARWAGALGASAAAVGLGVLAAGMQMAPALELVRNGLHVDLSPEAMVPLSPAPFIVHTAVADGVFAWGVTALALGAAACLTRRHRTLGWWAVAMTAITVVFALGPQTRLFELYRRLPFLGWFRLPYRLLGMTDFTFAIAAAVGLEAVVERWRSDASRRWVALVGALGVLGAVLASRSGFAPPSTWMRIDAVAAAAGALFIAAFAWRGSPSVWLRGGLVVLTGIELALASWHHLFTYADVVGRYRRHEAAYRALTERAGHDRVWFRGEFASLGPEMALKLATRYRVRSLDDYEPLAPRRQAEYLTFFTEGTPDYRRPPWLFAGSIGVLAPPAGVAPAAVRRRLLDLAAVRFLVIPANLTAIRPDLDALVTQAGFVPRPLVDGELALFENPHVLPRAFVVYRTRPAPPVDGLLAAIASDAFDPLVESYVEGAPGFTAAPDAPTRGDVARIVIDDERIVEVEAALARPGLVVLADAFYPGWVARVDGQPAPVLPTNHLFRGVPAPAGTHRIRFEYRPLSVAIGAVASAIGWLAIGLLALAARRRKRVGSSSPVTCDAVAQC